MIAKIKSFQNGTSETFQKVLKLLEYNSFSNYTKLQWYAIRMSISRKMIKNDILKL
jgi:hypothetical protein